VNIDKNQIIDLLKSQGDHETAGRAETELPDTIDTDRQAGYSTSWGLTCPISPGSCPAGSVRS